MASPASDILVSTDIAGLAKICESLGIRWLAVFGSVARGEATDESDVDLLVEWMPDVHPTYLDLEQAANAVSPLFANRRVDIGTPSQLHWYIRDKALADMKVLYER